MTTLFNDLELDDLVLRPGARESLERWTDLVLTQGAGDILRSALARRTRIDAMADWLVHIPWAGTLYRMVKSVRTGASGPAGQFSTAALGALDAPQAITLTSAETAFVRVPQGTKFTVKPRPGAAVVAFAGPDSWSRPQRLLPPYVWAVEPREVPLVFVLLEGDASGVSSGADLAGRQLGSVVVEIGNEFEQFIDTKKS